VRFGESDDEKNREVFARQQIKTVNALVERRAEADAHGSDAGLPHVVAYLFALLWRLPVEMWFVDAPVYVQALRTCSRGLHHNQANSN